jgi:hypothetical protein
MLQGGVAPDGSRAQQRCWLSSEAKHGAHGKIAQADLTRVTALQARARVCVSVYLSLSLSLSLFVRVWQEGSKHAQHSTETAISCDSLTRTGTAARAASGAADRQSQALARTAMVGSCSSGGRKRSNISLQNSLV